MRCNRFYCYPIVTDDISLSTFSAVIGAFSKYKPAKTLYSVKIFLTFNQGVRGSNPRWSTTLNSTKMYENDPFNSQNRFVRGVIICFVLCCFVQFRKV